MTFGEKFFRLIQENHWTETSTCERLGKTMTTFRRWKHGTGRPTFEDLPKIARLFGVSIDWLLDDSLGWDERPTPDSQVFVLGQCLALINGMGAAEAKRRLMRG